MNSGTRNRAATTAMNTARTSPLMGHSSRVERQCVGRFSYGVDSTIVVRVETLAVLRTRASRSSRSAGVATRTLMMYDSTPATDQHDSISAIGSEQVGIVVGPGVVDRRDPDERRERLAGSGMVDGGAVPEDQAALLQPLDPLVHRAGGETSCSPEVGVGHPAVVGEQAKDLAVGLLHEVEPRALRPAGGRPASGRDGCPHLVEHRLFPLADLLATESEEAALLRRVCRGLRRRDEGRVASAVRAADDNALMLLDTASMYFRAFFGVPDWCRRPTGLR